MSAQRALGCAPLATIWHFSGRRPGLGDIGQRNGRACRSGACDSNSGTHARCDADCRGRASYGDARARKGVAGRVQRHARWFDHRWAALIVGDPEAPIVLHEYSDYLCPFCARHFQRDLPAAARRIRRYRRGRLVFHEFPIPSLHPTAPIGHQAALCVAEQGPARLLGDARRTLRPPGEWNRLPDPTAFLARWPRNLAPTPVLRRVHGC